MLEILPALIGPIAGAAIRAGGDVGAAAITADAVKYSAKTQGRSQLLVALSQERVALAAE